MHVCTSMCLVRVSHGRPVMQVLEFRWSCIGSTSSLMTNFRRAAVGAAAIKDLGLVEAWSLCVRCLQTR